MKNDEVIPTSFGFVLDSDSGPAQTDVLGGNVIPFIAGATLNVGDIVYVSAADTVNKSNTVANYQKFAGVVVGGYRTNYNVITNPNDYGIQAAQANETVLVQNRGKALCIADAAVAATALLTQGAVTAGRVDDSVSATQGQIIGIALQAAVNPGDKIRVLLNHM